MLLTRAQILFGIERVLVVAEEALDAKPESFKDTILEFFADANRVLGTAVDGSLGAAACVLPSMQGRQG